MVLLAKVFQDFHRTCLQDDGIDPAHYVTLHSHSWDSMLKKTAVELELLTDIDALLLVERGTRGGISQYCNRYAEANNAYMNEDYNPQQPDKYLVYYDANNLYGWAMIQPLLYAGFTWADPTTTN